MSLSLSTGPIRQALSANARLVRAGDYDRFLTVLFAPADAREHLFNLYAFNLEVARIGQLVSEPILGEMRLQWWRDIIAAAYGDGPTIQNPVGEQLAYTISACGLPRASFERMLDTRASEFEPDPPGSFDDLEAYLDGTTGQLIKLAAGILAQRTGTSAPAWQTLQAVAVGCGLVGIILALASDARRGEVFIPTEVMAAHGVSTDMLRRQNFGAPVQHLVSAVAERGADQLSRGRKAAEALPPGLRPILGHAVLASGYLRKLRRRKYDPFGLPESVAPYRRQLWLLSASLFGRY